MRNVLVVICVAALGATSLQASPASADALFNLGHAAFISGTESAAGSALFKSSVHSTAINPALVGGLQRFSADFGYSALIDKNISNAFFLGALAPSRFGVFSGALQGSFSSNNLLLARANFAKDLTDRLDVGIGLVGGYISGAQSKDWALAIDLGFVHKLGNLGFLQDTRIGFVLAGLGKTFDHVPATYSFSPQVGFSALFFNKAKFTAGCSANLAFVFLQDAPLNAIFSAGLDTVIAKVFFITIGWEINAISAANSVSLPSVGIGCNFTMQGSDLAVAGAWCQKPGGQQELASSASINLGTLDKEPPAIRIFQEETGYE